MAGTTGLEPATSAVTAKRKHVVNRKQGQRTTPLEPLGTSGNSYCTLNEPTTSVQMTSAFPPSQACKKGCTDVKGKTPDEANDQLVSIATAESATGTHIRPPCDTQPSPDPVRACEGITLLRMRVDKHSSLLDLVACWYLEQSPIRLIPLEICK